MRVLSGLLNTLKNGIRIIAGVNKLNTLLNELKRVANALKTKLNALKSKKQAVPNPALYGVPIISIAPASAPKITSAIPIDGG
ncbi:hypothetical protein [Solibacillus sp. FSL H8-0538]|uniref:hypothetical protein n=1 Tax=Solibacillus sp. FSL H8-0538 TaxID=2921400 RepID=UPI0030FD1668